MSSYVTNYTEVAIPL